MRDWNFLHLENQQLPQHIFSLPMRDWNISYIYQMKHLSYMHIFSLPMRDWNWAEYFKKPEEADIFSAYLWGIETRIALKEDFVFPFNFQPTYEGLKLQNFFFFS